MPNSCGTVQVCFEEKPDVLECRKNFKDALRVKPCCPCECVCLPLVVVKKTKCKVKSFKDDLRFKEPCCNPCC